MERALRFELTSYDGQRLAAYRWTAPKPRGALLMLHGYAEHAMRHVGLAGAAADAGLDVWSFDQRNHGNSPGAVRGAVEGYEPTLHDLAALEEQARETLGAKLPLFLFGHSMGGAIALRYALEHPTRLAGLVLSAPFLLDAASRPRLLTSAAGVLGGLLPTLPTVKLPPEGISRDPEQVRRYAEDPLIYRGGVRAGAGATMIEQGVKLLEFAPTLQVRTFVVHGEDDRVAAVAGSRQLSAASGLVELLELPGGYHELHHDPEESGVPTQARAAILEWLEGRLEGWAAPGRLEARSG